MRTYYLPLICLLFSFSITAQISDNIHLDQFGYSAMQEKVAVIADPQIGFNSNDLYNSGELMQVRDLVTDSLVYEGAVSSWKNGQIHELSGDRGWWFDFSDVQQEGIYYLYDVTSGERSAPFNINANPYTKVLDAAAKMFYYNRCNIAKEEPYVSNGYVDEISFSNALQDTECRYVYDVDNANLQKDLSGGWFDAGDNNKYVTYAHSVIHNLCGAYEHNPEAFHDATNIPESGDGIPDILNEIKWELDWLLKMSNTDGTAHIKMGNISYDDNSLSPPSANTDQRYYGPVCTTASIATASMLARAAIVFQDSGQEDFAEILKLRAEACWNYFKLRFSNNDLDYECDDGTIKAGDADWGYDMQYDAAVIASLYLYELTGEESYHDFFLQYFQGAEQISTGYWGPYLMPLNEALLRYTQLSNTDVDAVNIIKSSAYEAVNNNWENFYLFTDEDMYRAHAPSYMYSWGSNQTLSNLGVLCMLLDRYEIHTEQSANLILKAKQHMHYMHGVNPLGLVMLSNMYEYGGDKCVDEIYHFWFANGTQWDNVKEDMYGPAPGFLTGGVNDSYSGELTPPANQPTLKSYAQFNDGFPLSSWEITEPAIYYQAAYVRLLSYFVNDESVVNNVGHLTSNTEIEVYPVPSNNIIKVVGLKQAELIRIFDLMGNIVLEMNSQQNDVVLDISNLEKGTYIIKVLSLEGHHCTKKIVKI